MGFALKGKNALRILGFILTPGIIVRASLQHQMHRTTAMWLHARIVVINDLHHMVALVVIESL